MATDLTYFKKNRDRDKVCKRDDYMQFCGSYVRKTEAVEVRAVNVKDWVTKFRLFHRIVSK